MQQAVDTLRRQGFENVSFKNTWGSEGYKGINSTWRDPDTGRVFEVQFHTPESFTAKMDTHVLYENGRLPGVSEAEREAIRAAQNDVFGRVPVPEGTEAISVGDDLTSTDSTVDDPHVPASHHGPGTVQSNAPPTELSPAEREASAERLHELEQLYQNDFDQLKQDPDHRGKVKPSELDEARVALDLRENGTVPQDIQRPPAANQGDLYSPSTQEHYDIKGVHSSWPPYNNVRDRSLPYKQAYDPENNEAWVNKLREQIIDKNRAVILDVRNANQAAIDDLAQIIEQNGWSERVVWYP